jgi:hypothetical protein
MARPHKIGVLTFHRCINYGSYWQARRLVEGLRARGRDAVLLDHESAPVKRAEWRCALRPHEPFPTRAEDRPLYARKVRKFFDAFVDLPVSAPFSLDDPAQMDRYDAIVVGSDEVWNLRHPWYGRYPAFFGNGLRTERLVSYAASFGNYEASHGLHQDMLEGLRRFDAISVRDENSLRLVSEVVDGAAELVLDPCLQFAPTREDAANENSDFVAVYGHSFPGWFGPAVRAWAKSRGYRLVSIGYRNDWADEQRIDAGPEEFAQHMAKSVAVATNFFHGCVFALTNGKPFACAATDYRANKVRSLAASVGAVDRLVGEETPPANYHAILGEPLGSDLRARIDALRRKSDAYLDQAIA